VRNQTQYPTDRWGGEEKTAYLLYLGTRGKRSASRPEHFTRSETTKIPTGRETGCFTEPVYMLQIREKKCSLTGDRPTILMNCLYIHDAAIRSVEPKGTKTNGCYKLRDHKVQVEKLIVVQLTKNSVLMEPETSHRRRQQSRQRTLHVNPLNPRNSPHPIPVSTSSSDNQA
jgi:hypothetical protein